MEWVSHKCREEEMRGKNGGRCVVGQKERKRRKGVPSVWWGKMVTE